MSFKNYVSRRVEWHGLDCRTSVSISILRIPLNPSLTLRLLYTYVLYIYIYIWRQCKVGDFQQHKQQQQSSSRLYRLRSQLPVGRAFSSFPVSRHQLYRWTDSSLIISSWVEKYLSLIYHDQEFRSLNFHQHHEFVKTNQ